MSVIQQEFGMTGDGHKVSLYVRENASGMRAAVSDFGALLVKLEVPDHSGKLRDVVLGYDSVQEYEVNMPFFGAIIGPVANRTGNAKFTLHGKTYQLLVNDGKIIFIRIPYPVFTNGCGRHSREMIASPLHWTVRMVTWAFREINIVRLLMC